MYERFNSKKKKKKKKRTPPSNNPRVPRVLGTGTVKGGYTTVRCTKQQQKIGEVFEDSRHPYPQNSKFTEQRGNSTEATQG